MSAPLLMIPGPIEVSPAVIEASSGPPPSHLAPGVMEDFGAALRAMRHVWCADEASQPFAIGGSGTIAMEMAVVNLVEAGDRVLVINTGYFSDRMAEMLRRRGARVDQVRSKPGDAPTLEEVRDACDGRHKALFATHVDTSTGVRVDAQALAHVARETDTLSVFDGVCATAGERFEMEAWGADVYLTASQKAIGLPAGLALLVVGSRALRARERLSHAPPMSLDFLEWQPILRAYEEGRPSYFSTPPTTLIRALRVGLDEILAGGSTPAAAMEARFELHERMASRFRAAWSELGLSMVPVRPELAANTLSAVYFPDGVGPELVGAIKARGVVVAGGLHPALKTRYFRVGHMGHVLTRPADVERTIDAVSGALDDVR